MLLKNIYKIVLKNIKIKLLIIKLPNLYFIFKTIKKEMSCWLCITYITTLDIMV